MARSEQGPADADESPQALPEPRRSVRRTIRYHLRSWTHGWKRLSRKPSFNAIMRDLGLTLEHTRDSFKAVLHLVTAADGAEDYYTTANNSARNDTPKRARLLDRRTQEAWIGHPHMRIIGNDPVGFDLKMKRVIAAVARVLGIPCATRNRA